MNSRHRIREVVAGVVVVATGLFAVQWVRAQQDPHSRARVKAPQVVTELSPVAAPAVVAFVGPEGEDLDGYPTQHVDVLALRSRLREGRFDLLERDLNHFQTAFEKSPRYEMWPRGAADAFDHTEDEMGARLDAWVKASPKSFAPYLARGAFRHATMWALRGTQYVQETHPDDLAAMKGMGERALEDLDAALRLHPKLVVALQFKMKVLKVLGRRDEASEVLAQALTLCPTCYTVRLTQLLMLEPRWGGSYEAMEQAARGAPVKDNPRLKLLSGFVDSERAHELEVEGRDEEALVVINRACALGAWPDFRSQRANILLRLDRTDEAAADFEFVDRLTAPSAYTKFGLARVAGRRGDFERACRLVLEGLRLEPTHKEGKGLRAFVVKGITHQAWELHKADAGNDSRALRLLELGLELDPLNKDLHERKNWLVSPGQAPDESGLLSLMDKVNESPGDFEAVRRLDYALAKLGRFSDVVVAWSRYLEEHPRDGKAFLERGGAYWRQGKQAEAKRDARQACELGVNEGCARAK